MTKRVDVIVFCLTNIGTGVVFTLRNEITFVVLLFTVNMYLP